jgi:hypothetical protein
MSFDFGQAHLSPPRPIHRSGPALTNLRCQQKTKLAQMTRCSIIYAQSLRGQMLALTNLVCTSRRRLKRMMEAQLEILARERHQEL